MYKVISIDLENLTNFSPLLMNEDSLNLETDDVSSTEALRRLTLFRENFLLNNNPVPELAATLKRSDIDLLYNKVSQFSKPEKKCITALLVHFANEINSGVHTFHPLFQPVYLALKQYDAYSMTYIYETKEIGKKYHFVGGNLVECAVNEDIKFQLDYANYSLINHTNDRTKPFTPLITNIDSESQLFPFQLIYTLMDNNGADQISLKNCMSEFIHDPAISLKHSLLLSAPPITNRGDFFNKYANRSHLCPPCGRFGFTLDL